MMLGVNHVAISVPDMEYDRLKGAGMKFHCTPIQVVEGVRTVLGRDPFGNGIELEEAEGRESPTQPALPGWKEKKS